MATHQQIRFMQTQQPFQPFSVKLNGGRSFEVRHPENISCSVNGREIVVHDEEGMHLIEALMIEILEPLGKSGTKKGESNGA
jgi:hypothetical protein